RGRVRAPPLGTPGGAGSGARHRTARPQGRGARRAMDPLSGSASAGPVRRSGPDGEMGGPEPRREAPALFGGFGSGLAVVGAYLLAGELTAAAGDHRAAFAGYDRRMHAYAQVARSGNARRVLA